MTQPETLAPIQKLIEQALRLSKAICKNGNGWSATSNGREICIVDTLCGRYQFGWIVIPDRDPTQIKLFIRRWITFDLSNPNFVYDLSNTIRQEFTDLLAFSIPNYEGNQS